SAPCGLSTNRRSRRSPGFCSCPCRTGSLPRNPATTGSKREEVPCTSAAAAPPSSVPTDTDGERREMKLDAGIYEFMKAFRDDRLAKMDSGDIPVSLAEGPTTVLHVLPASAFDPGASVNLSTVAHERSLTGLAGEQWSLSYDFEGVLV